MLTLFEYSNSWNSPKFWFKPNIGDVASTLSYSHGLSLNGFSQEFNNGRCYGSFTVCGDFYDVKLFGQRLEKDYKDYLTRINTDWDYYENSFE